ncbi:AP2-domain-containing protein, partial [Haematococcus lacustris]
VATLFHSALEALMHHDSVRTLNGGSRQRTAVREHNDAEALCGASWYKVQQRWQAYVTHDGRKFHLGWYQHEEHAAKVRDLMAIKLRGVHTPLNFVPETYSDMYELLAQVDQVAGWWVMLCCMWHVSHTPRHCESFSRTWKKLLVESARQQQRMTCEAATEASDPTMGTDTEDAAPTATTLPCQPSHPLTPHSAAGCGMAMGDDVATRFDAALDELLLHASVRALANLQRQKLGLRQHNDAGDFCGAVWSKANQHWRAQVSHNGRNLYLGCFQDEEHAAKVHDLMAIKLRGLHTPLNFVSKTYNGMYDLLAQVDQALLVELLLSFSRTRNKLLAESARQQKRITPKASFSRTWKKLLVESARQQQRMTCEAATEASDPTMGTDTEDAAPTATTLPCQPSHPLTPHSAAGCGMAMGDDVATRFDAALDELLLHASVRALANLQRQKLGLRQHNDAGDFCGAVWSKANQHWRAQVSHNGRNLYLGCFQDEEHAAKVHDLMAIKLRGLHTPLNFVSKTYNGMYDLLAQVDQALLVELLLSFSRTRNKLLAESARQQKRITPKAVLEASDLTMSTDGEDSSNKVAAMFDPVLEALLLHNSVRSLNRLQPGLRQHKEAGGLCGVFWNKAQQRPWTVGDVEATTPPLAPHMTSLLPCGCQRQPTMPPLAPHMASLHPCSWQWQPGAPACHALTALTMQAQLSHHGRKVYLGCFQHEEHAAKVHDLMAIKLRGMHTPLNFVPETYNDMYELLAQMEQPLLLELLRAFNRKNKKLLAEAGRQQGCTIQEAGLTARDPAMHPDLSDASSPTATTLPRQAGQPPAPPSAAAPGEAQCSVEAPGWPCDAAGSEAAASLPPSKRPRRPAMALIGSAPLGSSAQGTSTRRCPSAAAVCADTTASNSNALGMTLPAAPQLVGAPGVSLGVSKGRARPASRGWAEADALWEQAEHVHEGGGGDGEAMLPGSSHATAGQDSDAQEDNQVGRLLPDAGSNVWYADSSEWGPRQVEADVAGHALGARQQGALPLPAAQAKSAGALPSQRAGQAPGLMPCPVRRKIRAMRGSMRVDSACMVFYLLLPQHILQWDAGAAKLVICLAPACHSCCRVLTRITAAQGRPMGGGA